MMPALIEAALRSLLVGLVVALGLRVFRIRNVPVQKAAWSLVLVAAFVMPLLLPVSARWQALSPGAALVLPVDPMTLLEELQARIQAKSNPERRMSPSATPVPRAQEPVREAGPTRSEHAKQAPSDRRSPARVSLSVEPTAMSPAKANQPQSRSTSVLRLSTAAFVLYLAVVAVLLLRIALALAATLRLWLSANPVPAHKTSCLAASVPVRASRRVSSPVTIGSGILLPASYEEWDLEKLRVVLTHERSHVRQGDFYLQLFAAFYAALVWFSPLGWWLKSKLADLAEAISDRAGIEAARSRTSYAEVLLEFAGAPRAVATGVAMARPATIARRIEHLLNDHAFRQSFANSRRTIVAVVLVPLAIFAATAMVRVQAAPAGLTLSNALASVRPAPMPQPDFADPSPQIEGESLAETDLAILGNPALPAAAPAPLPEPEPVTDPASEIAAAEPPSLPQFGVAAIARVSSASGDESGTMSFDRTLSVNGEAQLIVSTGSGDIRLVPSSSGQIHIHGVIHRHHEASEEEVRGIAANPPIEQAGNAVRVGLHEEHWHGISIDYQIEAPAGTLLGANSGSGNIVDEGVGKNAKLETGSGDIEAERLEGPFQVKTGSGNITAEEVGEGDAKAETGSGDITIKGVHGGLHAQTGSGDIKVTGTPSSSWTLETGSGNVEFWGNNAPMTLDASTGSGEVTTDHEMLVRGSLSHQHITGSLNGGGPAVRMQTGSGDIHVH
jgi:beta-lactamase regulating signal transducer with metallopeptidase domain